MSRLPMDWTWTTLGEIADVVGGVTKDAKREGRPGLVEMPYLRVANVQRGHIDLSNVASIRVPAPTAEKLMLQPGDVLLNEGGDRDKLGRGWVWQGEINPCIHQNHVFRARIRHDQLHPKLLAWYANEVAHKWFEVNGKQSVNLASISLSRIKKFPLPIPPLDQQRRIVDILEYHLSRLDAADGLATKRRLQLLDIAQLSRRRRELVDRSAPLVTIASFCDTSLGKMLDAKKAVGEPTPYLRNINVRWRTFDLSHVSTVPLTPEERMRFELRSGDILACEGGEPGRCAVWNDEYDGMTFQKALHRIRIRDCSTASPTFVALMLEEAIRSGRNSRMFTGPTIKHLPQERLRLIELPLPSSPSEQREITDYVEAATSATRRLADELDAVHAHSRALRRALLTAAFSGRLAERARIMDLVEEMAGV